MVAFIWILVPYTHNSKSTCATLYSTVGVLEFFCWTSLVWRKIGQ